MLRVGKCDFSECKIRVGLEFSTKKTARKTHCSKVDQNRPRNGTFRFKKFSGMKPKNFQFHKLAPK